MTPVAEVQDLIAVDNGLPSSAIKLFSSKSLALTARFPRERDGPAAVSEQQFFGEQFTHTESLILKSAHWPGQSQFCTHR